MVLFNPYKREKMIKKVFTISIIVFGLSSSLYSASIPERFNEIDKEFFMLVKETNLCVQSMQASHKHPKQIDNCKSALKIEKKDIDRLKRKFNKQLDRYKQRKEHLTEEERSLSKLYVLKIRDTVTILRNNIKIIFAKN